MSDGAENTTAGDGTVRRVLVVDDQRSFSGAMQLALDVQDDLECVGVAYDGRECRALVEATSPDVVLLDVHLPDVDGLDVAAELVVRTPPPEVLVLTGAPDAAMLARAIDIGVAGFLLKDHPLDEILDAVRQPVGAQLALDPAMLAEVLAEAPERTAPAMVQPLTDREQTVLELLGIGRVPKEIARELDITLNTARGHVKAILAKLDCHSALEAVITAQRLGLLQAARQDTEPSSSSGASPTP